MENENVLFNKFIILWVGQFISAIGTGLSSFGLGVCLRVNRESIYYIPCIFICFLPSILLGPIAGVLADRYDRRLLMIIEMPFLL